MSMRMEIGDYFAGAACILYTGAAVSFVVKKRYVEAVLWSCYAVSNLCILILSISRRKA